MSHAVRRSLREGRRSDRDADRGRSSRSRSLPTLVKLEEGSLMLLQLEAVLLASLFTLVTLPELLARCRLEVKAPSPRREALV